MVRWDEKQLSSIVQDLKTRYQQRDLKCEIWNALIFGRDDDAKTGTYVPKPFDRSQLVIKTRFGDLVHDAQQLTAQITENQARVMVVTTNPYKREVSQRARENAAELERGLMGLDHAAGGEAVQEEVAWSQITMGCGAIVTYEQAAGWGLPERIFYDELSDDDLQREDWPEGRTAARDKNGRWRQAETADLWERRKAEARANVAGTSLFHLEAVPWDKLYVDEDKRGIKCAVIIEEVPALNYGPESEMLKGTDFYEYGLIKGSGGSIVGGVSVGDVPESSSFSESWTLHRIFTRDEVYHYVTPSGGVGNGIIVYATKHDYGEVPVYLAPFRRTGSGRPEERYVPGLKAAYALMPLVNQLATLMSNLAAYKGTPRLFVQMPDGQYAIDEATGDPRTADPQLMGNDPSVTDLIDNGGVLRSINEVLKDDGMMFSLLQFYVNRMDRVLAPPAATGNAAESGIPAWNTRLNQQAHSRSLKAAVKNHASAKEGQFRNWIRTIRRRKETVGVLTVPGERGEEKGLRYFIEIDPETVTDSIRVFQDPNTMEERLTLEQVGAEKLAAGTITLRQYFEDYVGDDDPDARVRDLERERMLNALLPQVDAIILQIVQGQLPTFLADKSPNAAQAMASQLAAPPTPGIAEAGGIRQPGVGMPVGQPPMPPMGGGMNGAATPV